MRRALSVLYLAFMLLAGGVLLTLPGCASFPPFEACYVHPTYGQVCVTLGGKKYVREDLTPEQKAEVEKWIAEGARK